MTGKKIPVWLMAGSICAGAAQGVAVSAQDGYYGEEMMADQGYGQETHHEETHHEEPYYQEDGWDGYSDAASDLEYAPQADMDTQAEAWSDENQDGTEEETQEIRNSEEEATIGGFEILSLEDAEAAFDLPLYSEISSYCSLDVPELLQNPELPTGCESVALTMALQYEGFELDKTTIASDFLIYNLETDNMAIGYVGDPFSEDGAGCFAPAIAATAESFFEDQGYAYDAYDITGSELEQLLCYVASGTPVVVWSTMYMAEPEFTQEQGEYGGKVYRWYRQEHCVVLSGYDLDAGTVQINDPLEGIVTRDYEEFQRIYDLVGQYAVVLKEADSGTETAAEAQ